MKTSTPSRVPYLWRNAARVWQGFRAVVIAVIHQDGRHLRPTQAHRRASPRVSFSLLSLARPPFRGVVHDKCRGIRQCQNQTVTKQQRRPQLSEGNGKSRGTWQEQELKMGMRPGCEQEHQHRKQRQPLRIRNPISISCIQYSLNNFATFLPFSGSNNLSTKHMNTATTKLNH